MAYNNKKKSNHSYVTAIILGALGIIAIASIYILETYGVLTGIQAVTYIGIGYIAACVLALIVSVISYAISSSKSSRIGGSVAGEISNNFCNNTEMPVVVTDSEGKIVWYNGALNKALDLRSGLYNKYVDSFCDNTLDGILGSTGKTAEVRFRNDTDVKSEKNRIFSARAYPSVVRGKKYVTICFEDVTMLRKTEELKRDNELLIMYILIDNLDELVQTLHTDYASIYTQTESIIRKKIDEVNGSIRESGHNRYIVLITRKTLARLEKDRFSILDEVREINISDL